MYIGQISNNPAVNADRYIKVMACFLPNEILLDCTIFYRNGDIKVLSELDKQKTFSTLYNMVNPQTGARVQRTEEGAEIMDENNIGTGEHHMEYPAGSVPEIAFLQNLPMSMFTNVTTVWGAIQSMITARVLAMDAQGDFNF